MTKEDLVHVGALLAQDSHIGAVKRLLGGVGLNPCCFFIYHVAAVWRERLNL